jgi:hypothetical protein
MRRITVYRSGWEEPVWIHEDNPKTGFMELYYMPNATAIFVSLFKDEAPFGGHRVEFDAPLRKLEFYGCSVMVEDL